MDDPEAIKLMTRWIEEQQRLVEASDPKDAKPSILLNLQRARLYLAAGCKEEARKDFEDALYQAQLEKQNELWEAIMQEMRQIS